MSNKLRALAIHLPQYHPIPENDDWWGKGFTEWTNVTKARPRFKGHYQPHLPSDLGFYDLRLPDSLYAQTELAKLYGIHGFMFYHYWFSGKRVLEKPMDIYLKEKSIDFPFMLCWANENWTRRWDGLDNDVLLKQNYSEEDDRAHIKALSRYFEDERYIKIDGKPVFAIYRSELFPDIKKSIDTWRQEAIKLGIGDIYVLRMETFVTGLDPHELGFDASAQFQPDVKLLSRSFPSSIKRWSDKLLGIDRYYIKDRHYSYQELISKALDQEEVSYTRYPGVTPNWDNTARRSSNAVILNGSNPELYEYWLKESIKKFIPPSAEENLVFINAWNEWAEGNHLEPCQKWGRAYLEATKRALES